MRNYRKSRRGFTLIEASLATVIIGVGVVAMLELIAAGTRVNVDNTQQTTATNLAKNVREYALKLPYAQLVSMAGASWTPPIDSRGVAVEDFDGWKQSVTVGGVDPNQLSKSTSLSSAKVLKLTVTVTHNNETLSSLSWYAFNATP